MNLLKNKLFIGVTVILVVMVSILGTFLYFRFQTSGKTNTSSSDNKSTSVTSETTTSSTISIVPEEIVDPTASWELYSKNNLNLRYPPEWEVKEESNTYGKSIVITSESYSFVVFIQSSGATSPDGCNYPDTPIDPNVPPGGEIKNYVEIVGDNGTYRRHIHTDISQDFNVYSVCKRQGDGSFISMTDGFFITYRVPKGKEIETKMAELDSILKKF